MDQELISRWYAAEPPFDGSVLRFNDALPLSQLRAALTIVVRHLRQRFPDASLVALDDWHAHDGYVTSGAPTNWDEIENALHSDESLYAARHGDSFVHRAFRPYSEGAFLLRFDVDEADEDEQYPGIWGSFDLAAQTSLLDDIVSELQTIAPSKVALESAKGYFDRIYAG